MTEAAEADEQRRTLAVAAAGTAVSLVAFTLPLIGLTDTAQSLQAGIAGQAWILSSMSVGLSIALLTVGALADDRGRRLVFVLGAAVLALSSLVATLAGTVAIFVAARIGQGVGAAAVIAAGLGLISAAYPPGPGRSRATGIWGASLGGGIAIGPFLAAGSTALISWRVTHLLVAVAAVIIAVLGRQVRPAAEADPNPSRRADIGGSLLLAAGLGCLLVVLTEVRLQGLSALVIILGIAALALMAGFVLWERAHPRPMIDLRLFRRPAFLGATSAAFATGLGIIAVMSFLATFLRREYGVGVLAAAAIFLAWSGMSTITPLILQRWLVRWPGRPQLLVGLLGCTLALILLLGMGPASAPARLVPGLLLAGASTGILNGALGREAVGSVPPSQAAMGSGANNTARYLGSAIGVTIVAVIATSGGPFVGFDHAVLISAACTAAGALVVLGTMISDRRP